MENVHIAHDCEIGSGCIIGNSTKFAGEVIVDDCAIISAEVLVHQFVHIGGYVMVQGGSRTSQDIPPYIIAGKEPIRYAGLNLIGLRRRGFDNDTILAIREAYNTIYSKGIIKEGLDEVKKGMEVTPEIRYILDFIEKAERGIIR
jgi:UDP-N-acetylglucosamine acyltransferase